MKFSEMAKIVAENEAKLEREIVGNKVGVVFRCASDYTVEWSRIRNEADLVSWIYHLTEKDWFTTERLGRFLDLVAEKKKWNLHCAP